jgi:8-oxo-dGTP diphosphatase
MNADACTQCAAAVADGTDGRCEACREALVKRYVVGIMFNHNRSTCALIRKTKPAWQCGLLNGIGGKIEQGETPVAAMVREFHEEAGLRTFPSDWLNFCTMQGPEPTKTGIAGSFVVECFAAVGAIYDLCSMTDERVHLVRVCDIFPARADMVENLCWLVALALDCLDDNRPAKVVANYSGK